jgi:glycosyltransferase involved in cell wall biosynthesis
MKVLFSAYACRPGMGSEPGIGWHWAVETARLGHQVWVLTRARRKAEIEAELARGSYPENLRFVYCDLSERARRWKRRTRAVRLYALLWQRKALQIARRLHREQGFEHVHHITFGSIRQPSFMGELGIPFTLGPLGGGESAPWRLRRGYPLSGLVLDALRDGINRLVRLDPWLRAAFRRAERILLTTREGIRLVPPGERGKVAVQQAIGCDEDALRPDPPGGARSVPAARGLRILFAGRLIYWKGMHLGLPAFERFARGHPDARLTMVGSGPQERAWRRTVARLGIEEKVDWISWVDRDRLIRIYREHDLFLYPSLHDSGGAVVLEALGARLPVVCLDLGGPGVLVDDTCGRVISTVGRGEGPVIEALAAALDALRDHAMRSRLAEGAARRAASMTWGERVRQVYQPLPLPPISVRARR